MLLKAGKWVFGRSRNESKFMDLRVEEGIEFHVVDAAARKEGNQSTVPVLYDIGNTYLIGILVNAVY